MIILSHINVVDVARTHLYYGANFRASKLNDENVRERRKEIWNLFLFFLLLSETHIARWWWNWERKTSKSKIEFSTQISTEGAKRLAGMGNESTQRNRVRKKFNAFLISFSSLTFSLPTSHLSFSASPVAHRRAIQRRRRKFHKSLLFFPSKK